MRFGTLEIDRDARLVTVSGVARELTSYQFDLLVAMAERLRAGLDERAKAAGFSIRQTGPAPMPQILFEDDPDFRKGFAFGNAMINRGVYYHPWHNMFFCAAMTEADIDFAIAAADAAMAEVKAGIATIQPHPLLMRLFASTAH